MTVHRFIVGLINTNCYLVTCEKTNESVIVDPGGITDDLLTMIKRTNLSAVLLTHGHFDHCVDAWTIANLTSAPIMIHPLDVSMLSNPIMNGSTMIGAKIEIPPPQTFLSPGQNISFGEASITIIHTPGHTKGSVSFMYKDEFIIAGDTLFNFSVGRWDLPGGDYYTLMNTLKTIFYALPDTMKVYPGHGDTTTIGFEHANNEFLRGLDNE
jgi:hydroxyacylglutathione hydrolase